MSGARTLVTLALPWPPWAPPAAVWGRPRGPVDDNAYAGPTGAEGQDMGRPPPGGMAGAVGGPGSGGG